MEIEVIPAPNRAMIQQALSLPDARNVDVSEQYQRAVAALEACENFLEMQETFFNHAERAAMYAKQLEHNELMEYARRVTALTWRKLGKELERVALAEHQSSHESPKPSPKHFQRKVAARVGITPTAEIKATRIASIPDQMFTAMVNQPGSCSGQELLEVARDAVRPRGTRASDAAEGKRRLTKLLYEFGEFMQENDPRPVALQFKGNHRQDVAVLAEATRSWLLKFVKAK